MLRHPSPLKKIVCAYSSKGGRTICYGCGVQRCILERQFCSLASPRRVAVCGPHGSNVHLYVCAHLDGRGGDLKVVQAPERALAVREVGRRQLMQELQRHHRAVAAAAALGLFIQLLLVQENGQRLLPCGVRVALSISKDTYIDA